MCFGPNMSDLPPFAQWRTNVSVKQNDGVPAKDILTVLQRVSEEGGYAQALLRMALPALQSLPEQAELVTAIEEFLWYDDDEDGGELVMEGAR